MPDTWFLKDVRQMTTEELRKAKNHPHSSMELKIKAGERLAQIEERDYRAARDYAKHVTNLRKKTLSHKSSGWVDRGGGSAARNATKSKKFLGGLGIAGFWAAYKELKAEGLIPAKMPDLPDWAWILGALAVGVWLLLFGINYFEEREKERKK